MDDVEVWPENWPAFGLFWLARTQWRTGMGGPTGLDYTALAALFELHDVPRDERPQLLADIQVMEEAALVEMSKKF